MRIFDRFLDWFFATPPLMEIESKERWLVAKEAELEGQQRVYQDLYLKTKVALLERENENLKAELAKLYEL